MIETRYKDPYVLNCGHTFEKAEADSLLSCEKCGSEVISRAPNFALKNLVNNISKLIATQPVEYQQEIDEFPEVEEHKSECIIDINPDITSKEHTEQLEEILKTAKRTNKFVEWLWATKFVNMRRRYWVEIVTEERIDRYNSYKLTEDNKPTSERPNVYTEQCIIL